MAETDKEIRARYKAQVRALVEPLSDIQVREFLLKALRAWRARNPTKNVFQLSGDVGAEFAELLGAPSAERAAYAAPFQYSQSEPWMASLVEFLFWMVRAGLAIPLTHEDGREHDHRRTHGYPLVLRLTRSGERFLELNDEDHPRLPTFVDRIRARCVGIPTGVLALLTDASTCLDRGLMRPAVVLLGVAYELAIETIFDDLYPRGRLPPGTLSEVKPWKRIDVIKQIIPSLFPGNANVDARSAALRAYDFADLLRARRNDAAHTTPTYEFDHRDEIEEFVVSAGRHLPALWAPYGK